MVQEKAVIAKVAKRFVPLLVLSAFLAYLDRVNVSFAAITMNADVGLSAAAYGFGAGVFFLTYVLVVPSNIILEKSWRAAVAGAHHVQLGRSFRCAWCSCAASTVSIHARPARRGGGRVVSRSGVLSVHLVSYRISRAYRWSSSGFDPAFHCDRRTGFRRFLGLMAPGRSWLDVAVHPGIGTDDLVVFRLASRHHRSPADATWLSEEEREWLVGTHGGRNAST